MLNHCIYFGYMRTVINIKTEKEVKQNAQKLAQNLGFSLSAVLNAYLKQFVRNKAVHFSIVPQMSNELGVLLKGIEFDIQRSHNLSDTVVSKNGLKKHFSSL